MHLARIAAVLSVLVPGRALAQTPCCSAPEARSAQACRSGPAKGPVCFAIGDNSWLTVGGEYRVRAETLDPVNYGIGKGPDSTALAHRGLLSADLHLAKAARVFVQLSAADETGRRPVARSFDESDPDVAQAFIEAPVQVSGVPATLRIGRQELSIGNRLVALRDGVTLKRAFDGVRVEVAAGHHQLTGFYLRPVENRPESFDDGRIDGETFAGLNWQFPGSPATGQWTAYAFERKRRLARFQSISGPEKRQTIGLKFIRRDAHWDVTGQASVQTGEIGATDILAWGGAVDAGWTPGGNQPPRFGLQVGVASGDGDPRDGHLGTFDPLYPNLGVYTDAPLYYYANQFIGQANVTKAWGPVVLRADATLIGRVSTRDAIYVSPGRPLASPAGRARLSAASFELSARWRLNPRLELYASVLHAEALDVIHAAGGRDTNFGLVQMTAGF